MRSSLPKPLHAIAGRSLLGHALEAAKSLKPAEIVVVVRHMRDDVAAHAREHVPNVIIADQDEIPGTGRAVQCAIAALDAALGIPAAAQALGVSTAAAQAPGVSAAAQAPSGGPPETASCADAAAPSESAPVIVLTSDCPLADGRVLTALLETHVNAGNVATILSARVPDPAGYGRIIRDPANGQVLAIIEDRDATPEQAAITEINSAIYAFDGDVLRRGLQGLTRDNDQREVLLTDVIAWARGEDRPVGAYVADDPWVVEGVNDRVQLAGLAKEFNRRATTAAMLSGVTIIDPDTTWIDVDVRIERDCTILPGTHLMAGTSIEEGAVIGPNTTLAATHVGAGALVDRTHATSVQIGPGAKVGPFTHLRPGTVLGTGAKSGSFVEIKGSSIGDGAKVPHLAYVGDATVGQGSNIGAGTIVANYNGLEKLRTTVGDHVRIGSQNVLVAPVAVGDGAYTGAGAVIRENVPPGALAVPGAKQRTIPDWVETRRPGTPSAAAARQAAQQNPAHDAESPTAPATSPHALPNFCPAPAHVASPQAPAAPVAHDAESPATQAAPPDVPSAIVHHQQRAGH